MNSRENSLRRAFSAVVKTENAHGVTPIAIFEISSGELAQMVERSLSMREVPGSIPGSSTLFFFVDYKILDGFRFWA